MNKEAIRRAADWLEANPDKHMAAFYAANAAGDYVGPNHPDAECFCAIGRIAKECGEAPTSMHGVDRDNRRWFYHISGLDGTQFAAIVKLNDAINERYDVDTMETAEKPLWRGNPDVIPYLRKLAA
jgi:hypothetical protein